MVAAPAALNVKEPKFAVPDDAITIAPLMAVMVKVPLTLRASAALSAKLKLAAVNSAAPLTNRLAPPPTVSVIAPLATSVSVPALLEPARSIAESSCSVTEPVVLKVNVAEFTVPVELTRIAPPLLAASERLAPIAKLSLALVARLMEVPLNETLPVLVKVVPAEFVMAPDEVRVSTVTELAPLINVAESSTMLAAAEALIVTDPNSTVPAANTVIVPGDENEAFPPTVKISPAESPMVTLVPVIDASPVTVSEAEPVAVVFTATLDVGANVATVSVTAPLDASVNVAAELVPLRSVEESSAIETLPVELKVSAPKLAVPAASIVIAPPPIAVKVAVPSTVRVSVA